MRHFLFWLLAIVFNGAFADEGFLVEEVAQGVFVHHGEHQDIDEGYSGDICNISFVIGQDGVAVIDTGGSPHIGRALLAAIRQRTDKPIKFVINTHVHPDHVFGNAAFLSEKPKFVGHAQLAKAMQQRETNYLALQQKFLGDKARGSVLIPPDIAVSQPVQLSLGNRVLTVTPHSTAHTHADVSVTDSQSDTLWTGDLLFVERTPSIDGDVKGWLQVIKSLSQLQVKHVVPGHGPVQSSIHEPFKNEKQYFEVLIQDIRNDIKAGKSMTDSMNQAAQTEREHWVLFDIVNRRNVNLLFPLLEWE